MKEYTLIQLSHDENGLISEEEKRWCLVTNSFGDFQTLCGDMYSASGSVDISQETTITKQGGVVTCALCQQVLNSCKPYLLKDIV